MEWSDWLKKHPFEVLQNQIYTTHLYKLYGCDHVEENVVDIIM